MEFDDIYHLLRSLWLVWLLVVFVGIIAWVMWPRRKKELEDQANDSVQRRRFGVTDADEDRKRHHQRHGYHRP